MAVGNAVYLANELDIPPLYVRTAGLFDGRQDSYDGWDLPSRVGIYADELGRQGVRRARRSAGPGRHAALAGGASRLHPVGLLEIPHKLAEPRTGQWLGMKIPPARAWSTVRVCCGCSRVSQEASRAAGRRAACSVCPQGPSSPPRRERRCERVGLPSRAGEASPRVCALPLEPRAAPPVTCWPTTRR